MTRDEALKLLEEKVKNKNLKKHMLATEAVMKKLAEYFNENQEIWSMAGLLHDLDYDETTKDFSRHGYVTQEILKPYNISPEIIYAICAHPGHVEAKKEKDYAI
ncbi:MAG: HDIG domain-containing protein [Candidatus Firestonebacteria bacterium]|nr:HDIG domain-containing protein [Candidatus Firestonebacteria bacterium]